MWGVVASPATPPQLLPISHRLDVAAGDKPIQTCLSIGGINAPLIIRQQIIHG